MTRIKVREAKVKIPHRVFERKNLPKFGLALEGNENVTLASTDFIKLEHPDDIANENEDDNVALGGLAGFIEKNKQRALERENDMYEGRDPDFIRSSRPGVGDDSAGPARASNTYVPPSQRSGAIGSTMSASMPFRGGGLENAFGGKSSEDTNADNTIKVSNLTKSVTEEDLKDLFGRFGSIFRVSLPKVERKEADGRMIKEPKGFAYVAFYSKKDAELAMEKLQGHGYDHLILKLEWAQPQKPGGPGGSGEQFRSGYGQRLAQDTTERVSYASNLTGSK